MNQKPTPNPSEEQGCCILPEKEVRAAKEPARSAELTTIPQPLSWEELLSAQRLFEAQRAGM